MFSWDMEPASGAMRWSSTAGRALDVPQPSTFAEMLETVHPDSVDALRSAIEGAITEKSEFRVEYRLGGRPPGDDVWVFSAGAVAGFFAGAAGCSFFC